MLKTVRDTYTSWDGWNARQRRDDLAEAVLVLLGEASYQPARSA